MASVLDPVRELAPDGRLLRIHYDWLEAGEVTQRTVARLSEQLRRYLDDQAWLENRRIMQLIRDIEKKAFDARAVVEHAAFIDIDAAAPDEMLPMDRTLFIPPFKPTILHGKLDEMAESIPSEALFGQVYVDRLKLASNVRRALQEHKQISLASLIAEYPLEQGLAKLATYLSLATQDLPSVIDDTQEETINWIDAQGSGRLATMPLLTFSA